MACSQPCFWDSNVKNNNCLRIYSGSCIFCDFLGIPVELSDGSVELEESSVDTIPHYASPAAALLGFQKEMIKEDATRQRICVCRLDGVVEFRREVIGVYKRPDLDLRANLRVRFDEEEALGSGPVREFLVNAIKVVDEGIPNSHGKPLIFFEGKEDHRLPLHDQSLRLMGSFKAVGHIIGHSILHGGPGLAGLSPAVKHFLSTHESSHEPPPIVLEDIADISLREMITQHVSMCTCLLLQ